MSPDQSGYSKDGPRQMVEMYETAAVSMQMQMRFSGEDTPKQFCQMTSVSMCSISFDSILHYITTAAFQATSHLRDIAT